MSTFEGDIAVTELLRAYPDTQMEKNTTMLERVERIKAAAMYDRQPEQTALPSPEVLAARLTALSKELISVKSDLNSYSELVETLTQKLSETETTDDANLRFSVAALHDWLKNGPTLPKNHRTSRTITRQRYCPSHYGRSG